MKQDNVENNAEIVTNTEQENNTKLSTCPCCGKLTMPIPAKIDQANKESFLAAILTGVPYTQTYSLFNSRINITIRELPNNTRDKLIKIANKALRLKDESIQNELHYILSRIHKIAPIVSIVVCDLNDTQKNRVYNILSIIINCIDRLLEEKELNLDILEEINEKIIDPNYISAVPGYILDRVILTHMNQIKVLIESGFDDSFLMGIVHVL